MSDDDLSCNENYLAEVIDGIRKFTNKQKNHLCFHHSIKLSMKAEDAVKNKKIFRIYGNCESLRRSLIDRGWIEKKPYNLTDINQIKRRNYYTTCEMVKDIEANLLSKIVQNVKPYFVYDSYGYKKCEKYQKSPDVVYNRIKLKPEWTMINELCTLSKIKHWHYIEGVSEVNTPRTFISSDYEELSEFIRNYKITACINLLKCVLSRDANGHRVFDETGNVDIRIFLFAVKRCKEYLYRKQHEDIDKVTPEIPDNDWKIFLDKYYYFIGNKDTNTKAIELHDENKSHLYIDLARILIQQIQTYRPEINIEGYRNMWTVRCYCVPTCSGIKHDIKIVSRLSSLCKLFKKRSKFVVQKYIEEPLLIFDTKFVIRQYFLVSSVFPLQIWLYDDSYIKFSSRKFNLQNLYDFFTFTEERKKCKLNDYCSYHSTFPRNTIWSLNDFKKYLRENRKNEAWDTTIHPGIRKTITGLMLSLQNSLPFSERCFELYAGDFIIDRCNKPWLIEIICSPNFDTSSQMITQMHETIMSDLVKVVIDRVEDPYADTGRFKCIYEQIECSPYLRRSSSFMIRGSKLNIFFNKKHKSKLKIIRSKTNIEKQTDIKTLLNGIKIKHKISNIISSMSKNSQLTKKMSQICNVTSEKYPARYVMKPERYLQKVNSTPINNKTINKASAIVIPPDEAIQAWRLVPFSKKTKKSKKRQEYLGNSTVTEESLSTSNHSNLFHKEGVLHEKKDVNQLVNYSQYQFPKVTNYNRIHCGKNYIKKSRNDNSIVPACNMIDDRYVIDASVQCTQSSYKENVATITASSQTFYSCNSNFYMSRHSISKKRSLVCNDLSHVPSRISCEQVKNSNESGDDPGKGKYHCKTAFLGHVNKPSKHEMSLYPTSPITYRKKSLIQINRDYKSMQPRRTSNDISYECKEKCKNNHFEPRYVKGSQSKNMSATRQESELRINLPTISDCLPSINKEKMQVSYDSSIVDCKKEYSSDRLTYYQSKAVEVNKVFIELGNLLKVPRTGPHIKYKGNKIIDSTIGKRLPIVNDSYSFYSSKERNKVSFDSHTQPIITDHDQSKRHNKILEAMNAIRWKRTTLPIHHASYVSSNNKESVNENNYSFVLNEVNPLKDNCHNCINDSLQSRLQRVKNVCMKSKTPVRISYTNN